MTTQKKDIRLAVYSYQPYMQRSQAQPLLNAFPSTKLIPTTLSVETAPLAHECNAVCAFVNDDLSAMTLEALHKQGIECIAMRCAGFDRVDLHVAEELGITVLRVPAYSPYAVAEHSVTLCLALNRQLIKSMDRVRGGNYSLSGLVGFDMHRKVVGIIGTGKIGRCTMAIYKGMGCQILAYDPYPHPEAIAIGAKYVELNQLLLESDVVSLHCPLTESTRYLINEHSIELMKNTATLINVSRGGLIDTKALLEAIKNRTIAAVGLDVYEHEAKVFFSDPSLDSDHTPGSSLPLVWDDSLASLASKPNVIITPHSAFLTAEALSTIASVTITNLHEFAVGGPYTNLVERTSYLPPEK